MKKQYESDRLIIKNLTPDYAPEVYNFLNANKEEFQAFELDKPLNYYTIAYQRNNLKCENKLFAKLKYMRFYVFTKENANDIIGTISLSNILDYPFATATIGYKFDKNYRHMGYATEALSLIINSVFHESPIRRLEAYVMTDNISSIHLLERIGFTLEGTCHKYVAIKGVYRDHLRYSLVNE